MLSIATQEVQRCEWDLTAFGDAVPDALVTRTAWVSHLLLLVISIGYRTEGLACPCRKLQWFTECRVRTAGLAWTRNV